MEDTLDILENLPQPNSHFERWHMSQQDNLVENATPWHQGQQQAAAPTDLGGESLVRYYASLLYE